ncbi:hypothetical protein RFF05_03165 [Bengtsoniella intestinalis]|uniref:hypothetical protein n=1 Tax=Bengtsoniella intestinalis TaxID=3073143 RepID=UPI00391F59EB
MYSTQTRLALVHARVEQHKKRQREGWIVRLSMLCCGLLALDMAVMIAIGDHGYYDSPEHWLYGASLLPSNIGGYVLVAIIAFVIAVAVTVLCMKNQEQRKQEEEEL